MLVKYGLVLGLGCLLRDHPCEFRRCDVWVRQVFVEASGRRDLSCQGDATRIEELSLLVGNGAMEAQLLLLLV